MLPWNNMQQSLDCHWPAILVIYYALFFKEKSRFPVNTLKKLLGKWNPQYQKRWDKLQVCKMHYSPGEDTRVCAGDWWEHLHVFQTDTTCFCIKQTWCFLWAQKLKPPFAAADVALHGDGSPSRGSFSTAPWAYHWHSQIRYGPGPNLLSPCSFQLNVKVFRVHHTLPPPFFLPRWMWHPKILNHFC